MQTAEPDPHAAAFALGDETAAGASEERRYAVSMAEARRRRERDRAARRAKPHVLRLVPAALALMVVGSLGPWSESITVVDQGIDRAGYAVMVGAVLAGLLLLMHVRRGSRSPLPLLAALVGTAAIAILASDFRELVDDAFTSPAWGLYAAFAGSVALVALSMALLTRP